LAWPPSAGFRVDEKFTAAVSNLVSEVEACLCSESWCRDNGGCCPFAKECGPHVAEDLSWAAEVKTLLPFQPSSCFVGAVSTLRRSKSPPACPLPGKTFRLHFPNLTLKSGSAEVVVDIEEAYTYRGMYSLKLFFCC
jgi:hypothetical protein